MVSGDKGEKHEIRSKGPREVIVRDASLKEYGSHQFAENLRLPSRIHVASSGVTPA
jgi:hypothetical protein